MKDPNAWQEAQLALAGALAHLETVAAVLITAQDDTPGIANAADTAGNLAARVVVLAAEVARLAEDDS